MFGCASLAAREKGKRKQKKKGGEAFLQHSPSPTHSKHQAKRPRTWRVVLKHHQSASPEPGLLFKKNEREREENLKPPLFLLFFFLFCSTLSMACTGMAHEGLLPCAICVQRFGNKMILQLIPLIARCCVLQRNRKPSHPSRHVVGAVFNKKKKKKGCFFVKRQNRVVVVFL